MADKKISELTAKTSPADADSFAIYDSENSATKQLTGTYLKSYLKTYFDTVYGTATKEILIGTGTTRTLGNTPKSNSLIVFDSGVHLTEGADQDYTVSGVTVTFAVAPDNPVAYYRH